MGSSKSKSKDGEPDRDQNDAMEKAEKEENKDDDEDGSDDGGDDEDEPVIYSDEAIAWAKMHFPNDPKKEKYFDLCVRLEMVDDKERIQAMNQQRTWQILFRNLVFINHMGLGDYFFVFKFGYDLKVVKKYSKPKSAPREIDRKTGEKLERKYSWVSKGGEGKVQMTPKAKNAEPTTVTNFAGFRFSIDWKGSYFDLYDKHFQVEMWSVSKFLPNNLVLTKKMSLLELAQGSMQREMELRTSPNRFLRNAGNGERLATLSSVNVFQERADMTLRLKDIKMVLLTTMLKQKLEKSNLFKSENMNYKTVSLIMEVNFNGKRIYSLPHPVTLDVTSRSEEVVAFFKIEKVLRYKGSAYDLKQERIQSQIYIPGKLKTRIEIGVAMFPLEKVLDTGSLSAQMASSKAGNIMPSKFSAWLKARPFSSPPPVDQEEGAPLMTLSERKAAARQKIDSDFLNSIEAAGELECSVQVSVDKGKETKMTKLWETYRQDGEINPPEIFDFAPLNYHYIGFKLKQLLDIGPSNDDFELNLRFVLEWDDQVVKTPVYENWQPGQHIDRVVYFLVNPLSQREPSAQDLERHPYISIRLQHQDADLSFKTLGTGKFFIHKISGKHPNDRNCVLCKCNPTKTSKIAIEKWDVKLFGLRRDYVIKECRTRVYKDKLRLMSVSENQHPLITFEAWFRGPARDDVDIDFMDPLDKTQKLYIRHADEATDKRERALCCCFMDDPTEKCLAAQRRWDPTATTDESRGCVDLDDYVQHAEAVFTHILNDAEWFRREHPLGNDIVPDPPQQKFSGIPAQCGRYHSYLVALDETHTPHFFPEFLMKITISPTFLRNANISKNGTNDEDVEDDPSGDATEKDERSAANDDPDVKLTEVHKKQRAYARRCQVGWEILQFVSSIPFKAGHNVEFMDEDHALNEKTLREKGISNIHAARPTLLLEMKRGDIRDHAMLLCCMLLGYGFDAYVCLGKVRLPGGKGEREHAWVMTREKNNEAFFTERLEQQEEPQKVKQQLEQNLRGSGPNKTLVAGAVRFWEVTTRKIFTLPSRWTPPVESDDNHGGAGGESKTEFDTAASTDEGVADNLDEAGVQWSFEGEDGLEKYSSDVSKALESAYQSNAPFYKIPDTALKVMFGKDNMEQIDTKTNAKAPVKRIEPDGDEDAGPTDVPIQHTGEDELMQMHMQTEKEGDEGERRAGENAPVFEYTSGMADGMSVQPIRNILLAEHTRDRKKQKKNKAKAESTKKAQNIDLAPDILRLHQNARNLQGKKVYRVDVPYTALYVIFNNDNLWVNTQHQETRTENGLFTERSIITDPALLIYDMGTCPDFQRVGRVYPGRPYTDVRKEWLPYRTLGSFRAPSYRGQAPRGTTIVPFSPKQSLQPPLTRGEVAKIESATRDTLLTGLIAMRNLFNVTTRVESGMQQNWLENTLDARAKYDRWFSQPMVTTSEYYRKKRKLMERRVSYTLNLLYKTVPSAYTARYQYVKVNSANPNEIRAQLLQTVTSPGLGDDDGTNNDVQSAHEAAVGDQNVAVDDDVDAQQKSALITAHEQRRLTAMEAIFMQGALSTPEHERTGKEVYTLGVKIVPWPNGIVKAYVAVFCIYPREEAPVAKAKVDDAAEVSEAKAKAKDDVNAESASVV